METVVNHHLEVLRRRFGKLCVFELDEMMRIAAAHRELGRRIVLTSGTWDMWHIGQQRYLAQGKALGDVLVVGVDSNEKVRARKGPDRPLDSEEDRLEVVLGCRYVDHVFLKPYETPRWSLVKALRPEALLATQETYTAEELEELKEFCGEVVVLPPQAATSATARIRLLLVTRGKKVLEELDAAIARVDGELGRVREVAVKVLGGDGRA